MCTVELLEKSTPTAVLYVEILGREEEEENKSSSKLLLDVCLLCIG
jgi:hypothetical protein